MALVVFGVASTRTTNSYVGDSVSGILNKTTQESLQNLAASQAGLIRSEFETALNAARTMAHSFATMADGMNPGHVPVERRREALNGVLLNVLRNNPLFNGTYSAWEPDALDAADKEFRTGATPEPTRPGVSSPIGIATNRAASPCSPWSSMTAAPCTPTA